MRVEIVGCNTSVCVDPPTQANTTGPVCEFPYLPGENCTYPCSPGYHVTSGDVITRTCTANWSWTESDVFCQACSDPLGMESGAIPDESITASSFLSPDGNPHFGRLNGVAGRGCWIALYSTVGQWFQVDLGEMKRVTGTIIQGRPSYDYWVTSYKLQYSTDRITWTTYARNNGSEMLQSSQPVHIYLGWNLVPYLMTRSLHPRPLNLTLRRTLGG
ncbi:lactadherin-like [Branchiostoma lanceolatum]|uniref:lactadherin-like n=1 Tax=Branchiostoma lanceolatum TaxID=7740 RepID=UPI003455BE80